jgi:hypothetical protein
VRQVFVHEAELELAPVADERAPGGAVTMLLCGHWEHEGRCRWPHHTDVEHRSGSRITVRTVFASDPGEEPLIRERIVAALRAGRLNGPSGASTWTVVSEAASTLRTHEQQLAERLAAY